MVRRRRFLLGLAAAAAVAGCTQASRSSTAEPGQASTTTATTPGSDLSVTGDGAYTVNVATSSDGSVSVEEHRIEFSAPVRKVWAVRGFQNGKPVDGAGRTVESVSTGDPPLAVGPTLDPTDDAQHAFATPIYDESADRFELWFYVDETYRNTHDSHHVVTGTARRRNLQSQPAEFTQRADGIYRATVTYDRPVGQDMQFPFGSLLNVPLSKVTPAGKTRPAYTAVGVTPRLRDTESAPRPPQISFSFEYDRSAGTVTVTHTAGDTADGSNLRILVAGETADAAFEGTVSAGDSVTVDVSGSKSGTELKVVWESGDRSATLALYELP